MDKKQFSSPVVVYVDPGLSGLRSPRQARNRRATCLHETSARQAECAEKSRVLKANKQDAVLCVLHAELCCSEAEIPPWRGGKILLN